MVYNNGRTLSLQYDNRMRPTQWKIPGVMEWNYAYTHFGENTGRVTYAQNITDPTLDRSYNYDHVGRLQSAYTGSSARAHVGIGSNWLSDGPYAQENNVYDVWGNTLSRTGWGGMNPQYSASYTNNKMNGMTYDNSGNLTDAGGGWMFTYDATGQQTTSAMNNVQMFYDGDRLRGKKSENGIVTYYLRSSVLGGQVVAELNSGGGWMRGYVYLGGEILAVQQNVAVSWMHQDPVAKSKRVTDGSGTVVSTIELDPWGGETNRSSNEAFQPRHFTTYEQDSIGSHDAMHRRYNRWWARFEQPDPYGGSYELTNPQSFNRYSYVQNDPVNFVDPTGLDPDDPNDPPPTTHTDPATGLPTSVPGVNAGVVTIGIGGGLGIGTGSGLGIIDQFEVDTGTRGVIEGEGPQNTEEPFLTRALKEATRLLQENADCANLFGGQQKAMKKLRELKFISGTVNKGDIAKIDGNKVTVDSGRFSEAGATLGFASNIRESTSVGGYPRTTFTPGTAKITGTTFGAFVVLHELGHRAKIFGKYDQDAGNELARSANNEVIRAGCFSELAPY
jgi:RHS repeat-associated protein